MTRVLAWALLALGPAYGCLWWSFQRFYAQFRVSPEDVGLSPSGSATSLPGAALQLGIWLLIALALLAVVPTLAIAAGLIAASIRSGARAAIAWFVALALAVAAGVLYWWLAGASKGLPALAIAAEVFGLAVYGLPTALRALTGGGASGSREPSASRLAT